MNLNGEEMETTDLEVVDRHPLLLCSVHVLLLSLPFTSHYSTTIHFLLPPLSFMFCYVCHSHSIVAASRQKEPP